LTAQNSEEGEKAGRVLSKSNEGKIRKAAELLQEVLGQLEKQKETDEDQEKEQDQEQEKSLNYEEGALYLFKDGKFQRANDVEKKIKDQEEEIKCLKKKLKLQRRIALY
jgi:hypothetical protein